MVERIGTIDIGLAKMNDGVTGRLALIPEELTWAFRESVDELKDELPSD